MGYIWIIWKVFNGKWIDIRISSIYKIVFWIYSFRCIFIYKDIINFKDK